MEDWIFSIGPTEQLQITEFKLELLNVKRCVMRILIVQDLSILHLATFVGIGEVTH